MPGILSTDFMSKLLGREWSFGYNCYEVGHCWTPSCTDAALDVSLTAAFNMMPIYALLYLFTQLAVTQKYNKTATWDTFKSTIRSSSFIFFNAYNACVLGCFLRNTFGRFYYRVLVCLPALTASYLAILIEKPARRQALAFYMLNLASEIVYRMLVTKGYFRPLKHGETLLFAASLSVWYNLIKTHGFGHDPISAVMKVLIGSDEAAKRSKAHKAPSHLKSLKPIEAQVAAAAEEEETTTKMQDTSSSSNNKTSNSRIAKTIAAFRLIRAILSQLNELYARSLDSLGVKLFGEAHAKHATCLHRTNSCLRYILEPIPSRLLLGYTIQTILKLVSKPIKLYMQPAEALKQATSSAQSLRFGLFLATLVSAGRLTSCLLRHYSNHPTDQLAWHSSVSGFVAGLSMLWAPKSSLSMYVMWKAIEQHYLRLAKLGKVPLFNFSIMSIYATSAATILYTFTLEPQFVRPSYVKVIDNMSNHRLHQVNRLVLDVFGTGSSIGYEEFFPDLHPSYMSNQFKELIFNWLIQPGSVSS